MTVLDQYSTKYENIRFERSDGVVEVHLHTNGGPLIFNWAVHRDLALAFHDIACDSANKVMILTGSGDRFCTQFDYRNFAEGRSADPERFAMEVRKDGYRAMQAFLDIEIPVISAINGPAFVHSELPVMADIVLAAKHTRFKDATHFLFGVPPSDGMHLVWTTLIGLNRGRYFLLTGQEIDAQTAAAMGIISEILDGEALLPRARELASGWTRWSRHALIATRHTLNYEWRRLVHEQLHSGLTEEGYALSGRPATDPKSLGVVEFMKSS